MQEFLPRDLANAAHEKRESNPMGNSMGHSTTSSGDPEGAGVLAPRRRGRSIDNTATGRDNESDEENGGGARRQRAGTAAVQSHRSVATVQTGTKALGPTKLDEVEAKCDALSNKLRLMERKVADRTDKLSQEVKDIKSKMEVSTPTRVLRSRNGDSVQTPASGTKRKRVELEEVKDNKGSKRERTSTSWGGLMGGSKVEKPTKGGRITRKSSGGALSVLPGKGRRSLNILKK